MRRYSPAKLYDGASCVSSEPRAHPHPIFALWLHHVWQTSNLRPLRLDEEERRNHKTPVYLTHENLIGYISAISKPIHVGSSTSSAGVCTYTSANTVLFYLRNVHNTLLWPPIVMGRPLHLPLWFLSFFFLSSFFPRLISAVADWTSIILLRMVWPYANLQCSSQR